MFSFRVLSASSRLVSSRFQHTHARMILSPSIERAMNNQLVIEAEASQIYLSWASWAERKGLPGIAQFFYAHSDEERQHLLKMIRYLNKRGGQTIIPSVTAQPVTFTGIVPLFEEFLIQEEKVTHHINELIHECIQNKDYITHDFLQWFVLRFLFVCLFVSPHQSLRSPLFLLVLRFAAEQIQEEALVKDILDRLHLIGDDKIGMYTFDRDIMNFRREGSTK